MSTRPIRWTVNCPPGEFQEKFRASLPQRRSFFGKLFGAEQLVGTIDADQLVLEISGNGLPAFPTVRACWKQNGDHVDIQGTYSGLDWKTANLFYVLMLPNVGMLAVARSELGMLYAAMGFLCMVSWRRECLRVDGRGDQRSDEMRTALERCVLSATSAFAGSINAFKVPLMPANDGVPHRKAEQNVAGDARYGSILLNLPGVGFPGRA